MKIKEIGGEFGLIERLRKMVTTSRQEVVVGIGDDAAVLKTGPPPAPFLLVTTDLLVENTHLNRMWATPEQIGLKSAECNVSDIAAMGGQPLWMFVSLVLPDGVDVEWVEGLYRGLHQSCQKHGMALLGGDTTRGATTTVNITLIGSVSQDCLCLRSDAKPGDRLVVSGSLGASAAGLALLQQGLKPSEYLMSKHMTPQSRMDICSRLAPLVHAMIDISDGLGAEIGHICKASGVGAEIAADRIPIHAEVHAAARMLNADPLGWAIGGGEDFELLFSIPAERMAKLAAEGVSLFEIGTITDRPDRIELVHADGRRSRLIGGFNHFK